MARLKKGEVPPVKDPRFSKPKMSPKQINELNEWIMERIKEGKTYSTVMIESRSLNLTISEGSFERYYYKVLKKIRSQWESDDYLGDIKAWIKESYLNLYEASLKEGNNSVARQVLNDLCKLSGINITKDTREVTIANKVIKFEFDTPKDNVEDN